MPLTRSQARYGNQASQANDQITSTILTLSNLYETHIQPQLPEALQPYSSQAIQFVFTTAPYLSQALSLGRQGLGYVTGLSSAASLANGSGLLSLGVLLITLYMGLRIANYVRRTIMGWVWLGVKLLLVLVFAQAMFYVNRYGFDNALSTAGWVGGIVWGVLEDLVNGQNQQKTPRAARSRGQSRYDNNYGGAGYRPAY